MNAIIRKLQGAVSMMCARAVVRLANDETKRQTLQLEVLKGELRDGIERAQNYGLTSCPHPGADAIIVSLGGSREQAVAIVVDDRRYRFKTMQPGEVALYDDLGNCVKLLRGKIHAIGIDEIHAEAPIVRIDATDVIITGDIDVTGTITCNGKRVDDTHTHGGVTAGIGNTAPPN